VLWFKSHSKWENVLLICPSLWAQIILQKHTLDHQQKLKRRAEPKECYIINPEKCTHAFHMTDAGRSTEGKTKILQKIFLGLGLDTNISIWKKLWYCTVWCYLLSLTLVTGTFWTYFLLICLGSFFQLLRIGRMGRGNSVLVKSGCAREAVVA